MGNPLEKYSHRDRLEMIMADERPDRFAAFFWRHFFHMEHHAEGTAEAMVFFQKMFDRDFVKINPPADYHVEDWGLRQEWSHNEFAKHRKTHFPVTSVEDWDNIARLEPTAAVLAEHLRVISLVRKGCGKEVPILMTLFSPLSVVGRMVSDRQLPADHLRQHPDRMKSVLEVITDTYVRYAAEIRNAGADGQDWLLKGTPDDVHRRIETFKATHDAGRLIIGPGCAVPPEVPLDNLRAVREIL